MDARGLRDEELIEGCRRTGLQEWAQVVLDADKVIVY